MGRPVWHDAGGDADPKATVGPNGREARLWPAGDAQRENCVRARAPRC